MVNYPGIISGHYPKKYVDSFFDTLLSSLLDGNRIEIRGFGVWDIRPVKQRKFATNPRTGEAVYSPPRRKVLFRPSKLIKEELSQPQLSPRDNVQKPKPDQPIQHNLSDPSKVSLQDLIALILNSNKKDWNLREGSWDTNEHTMFAAYKHDLRISIAWGKERVRPFREFWATDFPDSEAVSERIDILYNNSVVYESTCVEVDGGRAYLPLPESENILQIPQKYYEFISLINDFSLSFPEYENYFNRAGLSISNAEWPE